MLFEDKSLDAIQKGIRKERAAAEYEKESANEMLTDFYMGSQMQNEYIGDYGFTDDQGKTDLPMMSMNLTKKIIDKISLVYKYPPERYIFESEGSEINDWFKFNNRFSLGYKYAERYKNLLGKVLHRPHFNPLMKKWMPLVETVYEAHFLDDSPLHPYAFSYPYKQIIKSTIRSDEIWWMFWSDDFVFSYIPGTEKIVYLDFAPTGDNPFKVMPLVEMRKDFPIDQYECLGAYDLVKANQNVNIALNNLNTMIYFQAHDQMVVTGAQPNEVKRIKLGSAEPLVISSTDVKADLLNFDPKITESIEAIRFNIEAIGYAYNLKIGWSLEGNPASGFSLIVQNIDLAEAREDDVELMKIHEIDMYRVLLAMQEYYKRFGMLDKEEPMLPKGDLVTDFAESLQLPINQAEDIQRKQFELDNNIITAVDLIQEDNPDMDEDEATEKYMRNKKIAGNLTAIEQVREGLETQGVTIEEE